MFVRHAEGGSSQVDFQKRLFPPPLSPPFFPIVKGGWLVGGGRRVNCQIALYDFFHKIVWMIIKVLHYKHGHGFSVELSNSTLWFFFIRLYKWLSRFLKSPSIDTNDWHKPIRCLLLYTWLLYYYIVTIYFRSAT